MILKVVKKCNIYTFWMHTYIHISASEFLDHSSDDSGWLRNAAISLAVGDDPVDQ